MFFNIPQTKVHIFNNVLFFVCVIMQVRAEVTVYMHHAAMGGATSTALVEKSCRRNASSFLCCTLASLHTCK